MRTGPDAQILSHELVCRYQFPVKLPVIFFWINIWTFLSYLRFVPTLIKFPASTSSFLGQVFTVSGSLLNSSVLLSKLYFFFLFFCLPRAQQCSFLNKKAVAPSAQTWIVIVFNNKKQSSREAYYAVTWHSTEQRKAQENTITSRLACHCSVTHVQTLTEEVVFVCHSGVTAVGWASDRTLPLFQKP